MTNLRKIVVETWALSRIIRGTDEGAKHELEEEVKKEIAKEDNVKG